MPYVKNKISSIKLQQTDEQKIDALLDALNEAPDDNQESVMDGFIANISLSGIQKGSNLCLKCARIRLTAGLCRDPLGSLVLHRPLA